MIGFLNQTTAPTWAGPVETVVGWTLSQNLSKPTLLVVVRHKAQAETRTCWGEFSKNAYAIFEIWFWCDAFETRLE